MVRATMGIGARETQKSKLMGSNWTKFPLREAWKVRIICHQPAILDLLQQSLSPLVVVKRE